MNEADVLNYRPIKPGHEYDVLIPEGRCLSTYKGKGMTDFSIKEMVKVAEEYGWQAEGLADVLERETVEETAIAIHYFLYWHFQYKADGADQYLRTLACAWHDRANGIDCKSYTIIASSILDSLGIVHYIRKIKQADWQPSEWTHVYAIVPKDQKTGNLDRGYYTIDGTLPTMEEPPRIEKSDQIMSLAHYVLNGPATAPATRRSIPGPLPAGAYGQGMNGISFNDVKNLFSNLSCIGGTAYDSGKLNANLSNMHTFIQTIISEMNQAIAARDYARLAQEVNEYFGTTKMFVIGYENKRREKDWNSCSARNLDTAIRASKFYRDTVGMALNAYLEKYFIKGPATKQVAYIYPNDTIIAIGLWLRNVNITEPQYQFTVKPGTMFIPAFEITQYVVDKANAPASFDVTKYLETLVNTISFLTPNNGNNSGGSGNNAGTGNNNSGTGGGIVQNQPKDVSQAGFGSILGWGLLLAGGIYAFSQAADEKPKRTQNRK
jgi:hypothetical protein